MNMTVSTNKHAIALSHKEFALLETICKLGPCNLERVQEMMKDPDQVAIMRMLYDLTARGFLVRPEIDEQLLYDIRPSDFMPTKFPISSSS
jgi:hypothetical protein